LPGASGLSVLLVTMVAPREHFSIGFSVDVLVVIIDMVCVLSCGAAPGQRKPESQRWPESQVGWSGEAPFVWILLIVEQRHLAEARIGH